MAYNNSQAEKTGRKKKPRVALITGALGGIGIAFAQQLARQGYHLHLTDSGLAELKKKAAALSKTYAVGVDYNSVDLANKKQLDAFLKKVARMPQINLLVHSAGFGEGKTFFQGKIEQQMNMIQVHISATVRLTHAVLPRMIKNKKGGIILVSSIAAFIPAPGSSIYAASKSFLTSFAESLHMEVRDYGIKVQSLCPGLTQTGFHTHMKKAGARTKINKAIPWMEADQVVRLSLKCLEKGRVICIPGWFNKSVKKIIPMLPRSAFYALSNKIATKNLKP